MKTQSSLQRITLAALAMSACAAVLPAADTARGVVFEDANSNGKRDADERGMPGVVVSNQRDVVVTDEQGVWSLPATDDSIFFVVKPTGYMVPTNRNGLPQHYYIHKPEGSRDLFYPGVKPTGPLPASIDFPLVPQDESGPFTAVLFADTQPESGQEVGYIREDILGEIQPGQATFGMTLGDIMFDHLDLFAQYNNAVGQLGIPFYNVIGNHDLNFDSPDDRNSDETYHRFYGPEYFSFNWGKAHFIVLDSIKWLGREANKYEETIEPEQLEWLRKNLEHVPNDYLIVVCTHAPLWKQSGGTITGIDGLFDALKDRPRVLSVSGHTHLNNHHFFTAEDGWKGEGTFHQNNIATVCGSWWSGPKDVRGVPVADQRDGTPNGYVFLTVDGAEYSIRYKAAGMDPDHQMRVYAPGTHRSGTAPENRVLANIFDGIRDATVEFSLNGGEWRPMTFAPQFDPVAEAYYSGPLDSGKNWVNPTEAYHMWQADLEKDELKRGPHVLRVRYEDRLGRKFTGQKVFVR